MALRIIIGILSGEILLFGFAAICNGDMKETGIFMACCHIAVFLLATLMFCIWGIGFALTGDPAWSSDA